MAGKFGIEGIEVKDGAAREQAMATAATVNDAYSMAGARRTAAEAAAVGTVSLSQFDRAELEKLYPTPEAQAQYLEMLQEAEEDRARRRVEALKREEERRAAIVGGLAYTSVLDIPGGTDLDGLPEDALKDLPWNLPILGPDGYGTVHVRKNWTPHEALEAACMLDWNVRVVKAEWHTTKAHGNSIRRARRSRLIVRDPVERYAARCRCSNYHGRDGEDAYTETDEGKRIKKDPCPWTVEWDLGECRSDWRAEIQNEDLVDVLAAFTKDGTFTPQSCLWLDGGSRVAIQMKLADTRFVLGEDPHNLYLTIHNPFTGHGATKSFVTGVREACNNTFWWGESSAVVMGRAAHVGDIKGALTEVTRASLRAAGFMDQYAKDAEDLARIELSLSALKLVADEVIPVKGTTDRAADAAERQRTDLMALMLTDETVPPELRRTGYGAWQSVNNYLANPPDTRTDTSRLTSVWAPDGKARKGTPKARQVILSVGRRRIQVARP